MMLKPLFKNTVLTLTLLGLATSAQAAPLIVDWSNGSWDNGSGYGTGWDNQATSGTGDLGGGFSVEVDYTTFGTAAGVAPDNMTVSTVLAGGGSTPTLRLQQQSDSNSGSTLTNYSTVTLSFNQAVMLQDGFFTLYDVDRSTTTNWADMIQVTAFLDGVAQTVTYTTSIGNALSSEYGLSGVAGTASVSNSSPSGNVLVNIDGEFDYIEITYTQREGFTGSSHGIGISNLAVVPEPTSTLLAALAGGLIFLLRRRPSGRRL